jgi:hypothetical protein
VKNLVPRLPVLGLSLSFIGWSGREGAAPGITLQLSTSMRTVPEDSSASTAVTLPRAGDTGSVTFSLTGLAAGATISYLNPEAASSGQITVMATTSALGTYALTLQAADGTNSASSNLSPVVNAAAEAPRCLCVEFVRPAHLRHPQHHPSDRFGQRLRPSDTPLPGRTSTCENSARSLPRSCLWFR